MPDPHQNLVSELSRHQHEHGYLTDTAIREIAEKMGLPMYKVYGVASFYPHYRFTPPPKAVVTLCRDLSCWMAGGGGRLKEMLSTLPDVEVKEVSCIGRCDAAPAGTVNEIPIRLNDYEQVVIWAQNPDLLEPPKPTSTPNRYAVDPYNTAEERYGAIRACLKGERTAEQVIATLKESGLRGLGGAGFPTGLKWELVRKEAARPKYIVCNADESEPATFKDRQIIEEIPHLTIEGMILAAFVSGAESGYFYIRHEYEKERLAMQSAIEDAYRRGVLGQRVLGTDFNFELSVFVSPGGYVQGEESALLEALEGSRGEPRNKPPFPGQKGLYGQPTVINNVETLAMVPCLLQKGVEWWRAQGKRGYAGLKFFSVSGHVNRPGVYLIPMGTTIREFIETAGGMKDGRKFKAVLPGGASSNILGPDKLDTPMDFKAMSEAGSMLGSGAMVVIAEGVDLIEAGANITRFFRNESCGKCVPCRLGSTKAVALLEDFLAGKTGAEKLQVLEDLNRTMSLTSICGLGQVALGPMISVLRNFPNEIKARADRAQPKS
ncbi:MAG: NAD(P)H-dependent oxidoreductase subunit E [Planctomycetes bacterium]|nr:NAD(P)H-dependent oxidoreductase subunit E [Planctomycetota bacterium]